MAENFFYKLERRVASVSSLLCIGLDPHIAQLEDKSAEGAYTFCVNIINETHEYAACYKPNAAFFEQFGPDGYTALQRLVKTIPPSIPILLDCKRGDIDTTAQAYAYSAYEVLLSDAVTLSPYMGWDSVKPFVTDAFADKGAFLLCKTSNPSSNDVQKERLADGSLVYEKVARLCNEWNLAQRGTDINNRQDCLGLVVGATDLEALNRVRLLCPALWILCPGVGAQGGEVEAVCQAGLRIDGSGLLLSVSRGISSKASQGPGAMRAEAHRLQCEINAQREAFLQCAADQVVDALSSAVSKGATSMLDALGTTAVSVLHTTRKDKETAQTKEETLLKAYQKDFISFAIEREVLSFGRFQLKSGRISPYFFNVGKFCTGACLSTISRCYAQAIRDSNIDFDVLFGPAYKGIPLATAVAMSWAEMCQEDKEVSYNRKEVKNHGEGGQLVGAPVAGRRVLIVDDVITAGTAIREADTLLRAQGANVVAVAVCLDRQEKTSETSALSSIQEVEREFGISVISIVRLQHLITYVKNQFSTSPSSAAPTSAMPTHEGSSEKSGASDSDTTVGATDSAVVSLAAIENYRAQYGVEY